MENLKAKKEFNFNEFKSIISKKFNIDEEKLGLEVDWVDDLGFSSIDMIKLLMLFRQTYGINISASRASSILSVEDSYEIVKKTLAGGK
jgi:acyl carrier protein